VNKAHLQYLSALKDFQKQKQDAIANGYAKQTRYSSNLQP
jgi:hypothetical protein